MSSPSYSARDWEHLTRYHEHEWPDDWTARRDDRDAWTPTIDEICARHGLRRTGPIAPAPGSNLAVVLDDAVVKIFARRNPIWFPRELEALRVLESVPDARAPRLVADGEISHAGRVHSYLVMERVEGAPLRSVWGELSREDLDDVTRELAAVVRAVHSAPVSGLASFGTSPDEWVRRMRARAGLARDHFRADVRSALLDEVDAFLSNHLASIRADFAPRLLHADVIGGNILVKRRGSRWHVTGLVDFGDVEVGPIEYEWVSLCQKALRGDPARISSFFDAYGVSSPLVDGSIGFLRLYTVLHRFSMLPFAEENHPEVRGLEALLDALMPR